MKSMNRKGAMEMSVGTIVTIVLLITVLVLGLVLVRTIFEGAEGAIGSIDAAIQDEVNKLFSDENRNLVIFPSNRDIKIKKGSDPQGFAFSVKNAEGASTQDYTYNISAQPIPFICGSLTESQANDFIIGDSGTFSLGGGNSLSDAILVKLQISEQAPSCSFFYKVKVWGDLGQEENSQIFVTIK
jgi:hypothetical protein